ncbi:MAG: flagellar biosynthesis protein FlhB [Ruminococcaceae bacterium]|nr:flagellar biosynthesis protein FlhB [Oscillospiraceae bacterium]
MAGEKTEKATPKRRQDERKKGNVLMSREIVTALTLLGSFYALQILSSYDFTTISDSLTKYILLAGTQTKVSFSYIKEIGIDLIIVYAKVALPILAITCLVAIIVTMAQTRMLFSAKAFQFKGERINPMSGFKKMFSLRSLVELVKAIIKIVGRIWVIYSTLKDELFAFPRYIDYQFGDVISQVGSLIMSVATKTGLAFVAVSVLDYLYQWFDFEKNLRMSKQEIKDEYKQVEGDPQIKGRIRSMQQQRAQRRMIQQVPEADVVIRNPTHFAVAIKYDRVKNRAPMVVAKGADELALRIVKVAEENNVYITEDKPLARALYESVKIDEEIPRQFYESIAQVLAFVYNLKKKEL